MHVRVCFGGLFPPRICVGVYIAVDSACAAIAPRSSPRVQVSLQRLAIFLQAPELQADEIPVRLAVCAHQVHLLSIDCERSVGYVFG
jgi:hypothetical protein